MKTAAASVMSASASAPPIWNRMRKTSAFLRKLSLNAEKNWVQNRGAKRRVINKDEDMTLPVVRSTAAATVLAVPWAGHRRDSHARLEAQVTSAASGDSQAGGEEGIIRESADLAAATTHKRLPRHIKRRVARGCPPHESAPRGSLSAQRPLPCRLHHDGRNAETNGGRRREGKQRDPHGALLLLLGSAVIAFRAEHQRRIATSVPGTRKNF